MFGQKTVETVAESKSSEHCFIILNLSDKLVAEYNAMNSDHKYKGQAYRSFAKLFVDKPFEHGFLDKLMRGREKYFTFAKILDAPMSGSRPSKDISGDDPFQFVVNTFETRLSAELNMSLDKLNSILNCLYSEYEGKKCFNPAMEKKVRPILLAAFVETHVDIKNGITKEWVRVDHLKPKPQPRQDDGCRIA